MSTASISNPIVNKAATQILSRFNLSKLNLKKLTVEQVQIFKNPNKNSCLLTKLEILEKILKAKEENNKTISAYINELKGQKKANVSAPPPKQVSNKNKDKKLYEKIHSILMNYLIENPSKSIVSWTSTSGHQMKAKIKETVLDNNTHNNKEYNQGNILKIPIENAKNITNDIKERTLTRISINTTDNLKIDNVPIKEFFEKNNLNQTVIGILFPPSINSL